jgi:ribose transport system permease protein
MPVDEQALPEPATTAVELRRLRELVSRSRSALMTYVGVGSVLAIFTLVLALSEPTFATYDNLINILNTNAVLLVAAIGLTFVLLVGGFDLSIGGVLALSGVGCAKLIGAGVPAAAAIAIMVVAGTAIGALLNGLAIAWLRLSFFVVTLGTASLFGGAALLVTNGESQDLYSQKLIREIGSGTIAGVPWPVVIALTVLIGALLVTRYTGYGRMLYAVGGNEEAARLSGIDTQAIRISAYAICSGLAALAGVMEAGRLASAAPDAQAGIALTAAAAVLVGGTSFVGGSGGVFGTFLGALFLGVVSNGLIISGTSAYWQGVISGTVLVVAVLIDRLRRARVTR